MTETIKRDLDTITNAITANTQTVYQLYGLRDEEIAIIERGE